MGVAGAALATILSQAISAIWIFDFCVETNSAEIERNFRLKREVVLPSIVLGLAPFIAQATESLLPYASMHHFKNTEEI